MSKIKIELDEDTVDRIVVDILKSHLQMIKEMNKKHKKMIKDGEDSMIITEDLAYNKKLKIHIQEVLKYFGES